jgi:hypothetical protein
MVVCVAEDSALRPPQKLDFSTSPQPINPFVLNGSPMVNPPSSLTNSGEYRRTSQALQNPKSPKYFSSENYYSMNLNTSNIMGPESFGNTTMRYEGKTYTLNFMAIHAPIWSSVSGNLPQISLLFTTSEFHILHICIPIYLTNTDNNTNTFLRHWLYDESPLPSGFTVNEIFNFPDPMISFATLHYCLRYNNKTEMSPYVHCIFKDGLSINGNKAPAWIKSLQKVEKLPEEGNNTPYMRKTFDEIFNLMMHGRVTYFLRDDIKDRRLISTEQHFTEERTQTIINPINYNIKRTLLYSNTSTKKRNTTEGFENQNPRMNLQNVKCYPIDINSQIDEQGNVVIDQTTNRAIDLRDNGAASSSGASIAIDPKLALEKENLDKITVNNTRFSIILTAIISIFLVISLFCLIFFLRSRSVTVFEEAAKKAADDAAKAAAATVAGAAVAAATPESTGATTHGTPPAPTQEPSSIRAFFTTLNEHRLIISVLIGMVICSIFIIVTVNMKRD